MRLKSKLHLKESYLFSFFIKYWVIYFRFWLELDITQYLINKLNKLLFF